MLTLNCYWARPTRDVDLVVRRSPKWRKMLPLVPKPWSVEVFGNVACSQCFEDVEDAMHEAERVAGIVVRKLAKRFK
jgi:hypothetical protein